MRLMLIALITLSLLACKDREQVLQEAEEQGKLQVEKKAQQLKGIGEGLKDKGKQSAQALGEGVGEVLKGAAQGLEKSLHEVKIDAPAELAKKGVKVERAQRQDDPAKGEGVTVYMIFEREYGGNLALKAIDASGNEVGRAVVEVFRNRGDAAYVDFIFDQRTPMTAVDRFALEETDQAPGSEDAGAGAPAPAPADEAAEAAPALPPAHTL
jgi:hypothetical protein